MNSRFLILLFSLLISSPVVSSDKFGRFFTTAKQRTQLDELREARAGATVDVNDEELFLDTEEVEVQEEVLDAITIKGLVYRSNGKSSAWINDSNSYEGDVASQYTRVEEDGISDDNISVRLPGRSEVI